MPFGLDGDDGQDGISIVGPQGPAGTNGTNGINGLNGFGVDGIDGEDGLMGPIGLQGSSGINGVNGTNGANGLDGLDGEEGSIWLISPPTVSSGSSGVSQIVAGTNVSISPAGGTGIVTINASGGGGTWTTVQNSTLVTDTMTVTAGFQFLCARTFNNVGSIINNGDFVITH
jgi:hypothetical protein